MREGLRRCLKVGYHPIHTKALTCLNAVQFKTGLGKYFLTSCNIWSEIFTKRNIVDFYSHYK